MSLSLVILQLATAQAPPGLPDIELNAHVRADQVKVRQEGEASLALRVSPGEAPPVEVRRSAPTGAQSYHNLTIDVRGAIRIADPNGNPSPTQQGTINESTSP